MLAFHQRLPPTTPQSQPRCGQRLLACYAAEQQQQRTVHRLWGRPVSAELCGQLLGALREWVRDLPDDILWVQLL
eukprot:COSAG01_NODE_3830_length_5651_cov_62.375180_8_plen_75_part_00